MTTAHAKHVEVNSSLIDTAQPTAQTPQVPAVQKQAALPATEKDLGTGFENHTREDYLLPFISLLQSNSPQITKSLVEAKIGDFFNTATEEVMSGKDGFEFVPVQTDHAFVEWKPRTAGGGFVARHELGSSDVEEAKARATAENAAFGKLKIGDNDLVETFYVYGIVVSDGSINQAVIAMKSTAIKKYKTWMTKAQSIQIKQPDGTRRKAVLWEHVYLIKSMDDKNPKGDFKNFSIAFNGKKADECRLKPEDELYREAIAFRRLVVAGTAKADIAGEDKTSAATGDDEIPF